MGKDVHGTPLSDSLAAESVAAVSFLGKTNSGDGGHTMTGTNDRRVRRITRRGFLSAGAALSFTVVGAGRRRNASEQSDQGRNDWLGQPRPDDRRHGAQARRLRDRCRGRLFRAGRQRRRRSVWRVEDQSLLRVFRATREPSPPASRPSFWRHRPTASPSTWRRLSKRADTSTSPNRWAATCPAACASATPQERPQQTNTSSSATSRPARTHSSSRASSVCTKARSAQLA